MEMEIYTGANLLIACVMGIWAGMLIMLLTFMICARKGRKEEKELTEEQFQKYLDTVSPVRTMNVVSKNPEHMIN